MPAYDWREVEAYAEAHSTQAPAPELLDRLATETRSNFDSDAAAGRQCARHLDRRPAREDPDLEHDTRAGTSHST